MSKVGKIPERLAGLFRKKSLSLVDMNEDIVDFILKNHIEDTLDYRDIAEEYSLIMALYRRFLNGEIEVKQSRISLIVKDVVKTPKKIDKKVVNSVIDVEIPSK